MSGYVVKEMWEIYVKKEGKWGGNEAIWGKNKCGEMWKIYVRNVRKWGENG